MTIVRTELRSGVMSEEAGVSPFDAIRHADERGEYWSARELAQLLGYTRWQQFPGIITKAQIACEASGYAVSDHFQDVSHMIATGKGARRRVDDVHLSRYACYLVVQNADPEKPVVALGQTYFAVRTREQELTVETLAKMSEEQQRLFWREELIRRNRRLAATAQGAGVIKPKDFALFQDHGYMGLYNGETARDIAARKGLAARQPILDYMGAEELGANIFRATQTDAKIKRDDITTPAGANTAHYQVERAVRRAIEEIGGTMPEDLPTPDRSIQDIERDEQRRLQQDAQVRRQPALVEPVDED
jgi:DNA-damage-inducible protein D